MLDGIAFGRADLMETVHEGDRVDVVARLVSRSFGGYESIQLEVRDVAPSGSHPEARAILDGSVNRRRRRSAAQPSVGAGRSGVVTRVAPRAAVRP